MDKLKWLEEMLDKVQLPESKEKTIFDIARYPHYENVISNFYSFFFDAKEEHDFGNLFIESLVELINNKFKFLFPTELIDTFEVHREFSAENGTSIDLVISGYDLSDNQLKPSDSDWVIIIENKIYADIYNDLELYWNTFNEDFGTKVGIVFSLENIQENIDEKLLKHKFDFINITHKELIDKVLANMNLAFINANDKYLSILKDFANNIYNLTSKESKMSNENIKLFYDNYKNIQDLKNIETNVYIHLNEVLIKYFKGSEFEESPQRNSAKSGRHFFDDSKNGDLRFWINFYHLFDRKQIYVFLELHGKGVKKRDGITLNSSNGWKVSDGGGKNKDWYHVYSIAIEIPNHVFNDLEKHLPSELNKYIFNESKELLEPLNSVRNQLERV